MTLRYFDPSAQVYRNATTCPKCDGLLIDGTHGTMFALRTPECPKIRPADRAQSAGRPEVM